MYPTFSNCTLLVIKPDIDKFLVNEGDIVLINISTIQSDLNVTKIAHRVVENDINNEKISTRGDNGEIYDYPTQIDGWFEYDKILGEVKYNFNIPEYFCKNSK